MPIGSTHEETGLLNVDGDWTILRRDLGGRWRLEPHRDLPAYIGKRVRLNGVRVDFDVLKVTRVSVE